MTRRRSAARPYRPGSGPISVADGFADALKGLGYATGSVPASRYYTADRRLEEYQELYEGDWLARQIVQTFPEEAARKEPKIKDLDENQAKELWKRFEALNSSLLYPHGLLQQGLYQGRALGGAVLILGYKTGLDGDARNPAPTIESGQELAWLDVCAWRDLGVVSYVDDYNRADHGWPEIVRVGGEHPRRGLELHLSRTIPCEGLPRAQWTRDLETPWISALHPVYETIRDFNLSWEAASLLLQEASVGVLKIQGLIAALASKNEAVLKNRMRLVSAGRSTARTVFLDAEHDESFTRSEVSFSGVPDVLELLQMRICGAAKIPHTRLFRRSPDGQNATGESDMRIFYDDVDVYRQTSVKPKVERILSILAKRPVEIEYPALHEPTPEQAATVRKVNAEADAAYYELGVLDPADIAKSRSADGSLGVTIQDPERFDGPATVTPTTPTAEA